MALVGNYSVLNKTPGRFSGASVSHVRSNFNSNASMRNSFLHFGKLTARPLGHYPPYAWSMPMTIGAMSSFTQSNSELSISVSMAGGRNLEGLSSLSLINTNAQLDQIVTFIASSLMQFSTNAQLNASVNLQASAILQIATVANIQAIVDALASSSMAITPSVILSALAHMNAQAGGPTELSPEGLAAAIWAQDISDYTSSGTAGRKLNDAGSAGNPWDALLVANNTTGTFGQLIQKLLTVGKFLGLK